MIFFFFFFTLRLFQSEDIDGNFDNCFYNELCSHGFTVVPSFNNSWSNVSYIMLGILFCFVVHYREKLIKDIKNCSSERGIEFHKELFYALGIGLTMEGVFSGTYHLCPNKFTFQYGKFGNYSNLSFCG